MCCDNGISAMSDESQEFDKYGRKIRKGSPFGFLSSMARGGKELPTEKPAAVQSGNEEQVEGDAAPEFDKYGRKIRKGISLPVLPTVVLIAFFGGITAVLVNENQSGSYDSPKLEVTKKSEESRSPEVTRDASYAAFGYSLTDKLNTIKWDGDTKVKFSNAHDCKHIYTEFQTSGGSVITTNYDYCFFDAEYTNYLGTMRCRSTYAQYDRQENKYRQGVNDSQECSQYQ